MKKTFTRTVPQPPTLVKTQAAVIVCDAPDPAADRARLIQSAARRYQLDAAAIEAHLDTILTGFTPQRSFPRRDGRGRLWLSADVDGHTVQFNLNAGDALDTCGCRTCTTYKYSSKLTICPAAAAVAVHYIAQQLGLELRIENEECRNQTDALPANGEQLTASHPADLVAADLAAEYADRGQPFLDRLYRAVELVKRGETEFPHYDTRWENYGYHGFRVCGCDDAHFRTYTADRIGTVCKHTLAQLIRDRINGDIERAAFRKHADAWQRHRAGRCDICDKPSTGIDNLCDACYNATAEPDPATALPASAGDTARIEDYLGYDEPAEKPWYLRADPINRSRAGAGRSQFTVRRGRD